ncbi:MAG: SLC13 family permease [Cyanobacteriota bacterium]|nr:SLC13 family permease [Cyanobacteriota bacterium]
MPALERLPLELAALSLVIAAVLAGLLTPSQALAGFGNPAVITVVAMFVVSAALERSGALIPIERWLSRFDDRGPSQQILLLALVVGPLSAVISNTAVVAMFIPLVERRCRRLALSPSQLLMPLSFLTVLAGVGTLLGTSTTLVASTLSSDLGYGSFSLLQFTPMALLTYAAGIAVLALLAPRLLPANPSLPRAEALESDYGIGHYLSELQVTGASPLIGRSLDASLLQHSFDVRVLALIREGERRSLPLGEERLADGDVLVVKASPQRLLALRQEEGLALVPEVSILLREAGGDADPLARDRDGPELAIVEALVPAGSPLIGRSLREIRFAQRFLAAVLAIRRGEEVLRDRLGQVNLQLGDALLLQTPAAALRTLRVSRELLLLADPVALPEERRERLGWALALTAALLLLALWRSDALAIWALLVVVGLVLSGVLSAQEVYGAVRWDVVVLLGSLLPLAQLGSSLGLDRWLVEHLSGAIGAWPPYLLLLGLYMITALVTEVVSNQAAVTLMLPLGLALSQGVGVNPWAAMGVTTFAASHSFLTPIGYQTNTMVYAIGNYSFLDFLRLGLPLTIVLSLLTPALALRLCG